MSYQVGRVAEVAGVTVRTLHHHDEIGLLSPSERTHAGYRRYTDADLERLQQIRYYRELGFSLEEIAEIISDIGSRYIVPRTTRRPTGSASRTRPLAGASGWPRS